MVVEVLDLSDVVVLFIVVLFWVAEGGFRPLERTRSKTMSARHVLTGMRETDKAVQQAAVSGGDVWLRVVTVESAKQAGCVG